MARLEHPWKCDECGTKMEPSVKWLLAVPPEKLSAPFCHGADAAIDLGVLLVAICHWHDHAAPIEGVKHLCGVDCAREFVAKELMREMEKAYGNDVGPAGAKKPEAEAARKPEVEPAKEEVQQ